MDRCTVCYRGDLSFILIGDQREMEKVTIFQDWLTSAKGLYILIIIVILMRIVMRIGGYILGKENDSRN